MMRVESEGMEWRVGSSMEEGFMVHLLGERVWRESVEGGDVTLTD